MSDHYQQLSDLFRRISRLDHAITFLQWDHMVMMPQGGNAARSATLAELTELHHQRITDPQIPTLLAEAKQTPMDDSRRRGLTEMERAYRRAACLPTDLVKAQTLAGSRCEHQWRGQRMANDWQGFAANFKEVVSLSRQEAQLRYEDRPEEFASRYDAMVDLYCTGDHSDFIESIFNRLKQELPPLVGEIVERQAPSTNLDGRFSVTKQKALCERAMALLGFDFDTGRLDTSAHPFSTGCRGDHRITTRFDETEFLNALLATAHETGHAAYESGLPAELDGLPQGDSRNLCLHESQSLLFEKQIFLSRPFFLHFVPTIHEFLDQSTALSGEELWRLATRVSPSFIRVEADEATYPLHVILRFEIEKDLINAEIEVDDIPELWDQKMREYLRLSTGKDYCNGCMQDMHWTDGSFGYFPSYTIGAINAAQLFSAFRRAYPDWIDEFSKGSLTTIRQWLADNIWSVGATLESQEIMINATSEETNPDTFLNHLRERYLEGRQ